MKYLLIGFLKLYRLVISPLYGDVCRYYPSCSAYALRAVGVHGAVKGSWLAGRRLLRCHPWASGGYDPVPGTPEHAEEEREQRRRLRPSGTLVPEALDGAADQHHHDAPGTRDVTTSTPRHEPHGPGGHDHDAHLASPRGVY